jgi:two-component system, OmpR family, sensor histidine kinase KdpD
VASTGHDERTVANGSGAGDRARVPGPVARLTASQPRRRAVGSGVAIAGTIALALCLLPFRNDITPLSKGFGFLVVVVVAAWVGGLGPGLLASFLGFVIFNYLFIPPYDTFTIARPEYVVVLFVFLGLSVLISTLLARATDRAHAAEAREHELRILQTLSAELVAVGPGPDSYRSVLSMLLRVFEMSAAALYVQDPKTRALEHQITVGNAAEGDLQPGANRVTSERPPERLPLSVGGRNLGLIVLRTDASLGPAESRVLRAFCDQFALILERDRLLVQATQAQIYEQADEIRRSLLAAVSHDLRTPLAAIKTSVTDLLSDDSPHRASDVREALEAIDGETDRLTALVANLLDMSRIEQGILRARIQGVDLAEVLSGIVDRLRHRQPDLEIRIAIDPRASIVRADPVFLDRVLNNLLENAAKAAADTPSSPIEVQAGVTGPRAIVRVVDHGGGVPYSEREQLFYPFYQLDHRHPRLGTGLGLPIAKGFLSLMEGEIWIEDTPGGGATFAFSLPLQESPVRRDALTS